MGKMSVSVLWKLFINGNERCDTTDHPNPLAHERDSTFNVNNIQFMIPEDQNITCITSHQLYGEGYNKMILETQGHWMTLQPQRELFDNAEALYDRINNRKEERALMSKYNVNNKTFNTCIDDFTLYIFRYLRLRGFNTA